MDKLIIRTSDRGTFKRCRQLWDFTSKIRMNYEPNVRIRPLDMGTAIHRGLEVYHDPNSWHMRQNPTMARVLVANAIAAFRKAFTAPTDLDGSPTTDPELLKVWNEDLELGSKMLANYHEWTLTNDTYTPVYTEIEFEVPIVVPEHLHLKINLTPGFTYSQDSGNFSHLYRWSKEDDKFLPVYYQGRIDLILKDSEGRYWIRDFKTTAKFDSTDWLEFDPQCVSYGWAIKHSLGIDIAGVQYEQLRKGVPSEPKVLKTGKLSKDKSQEVTYKTYKQALDSAGLPVVEYVEFLDWLRVNEKQYFRQLQVSHTSEHYEIAGRNIVKEAMDMLGDPHIYPNTSAFNCNGCRFIQPCQALQDGSDWQWMLDEMFTKRGTDEALA